MFAFPARIKEDPPSSTKPKPNLSAGVRLPSLTVSRKCCTLGGPRRRSAPDTRPALPNCLMWTNAPASAKSSYNAGRAQRTRAAGSPNRCSRFLITGAFSQARLSRPQRESGSSRRDRVRRGRTELCQRGITALAPSKTRPSDSSEITPAARLGQEAPAPPAKNVSQTHGGKLT
jgi:hypothetical protein